MNERIYVYMYVIRSETGVGIKEEKSTAVVYITSFQGRLLEYDGGGGVLIGDGALIGYRALILIFTVHPLV